MENVAAPAPREIVTLQNHAVSCDGGEGVWGHPKVYLRIPPQTKQIQCPYCSRLHVLADGVTESAH